MPSIRPYKFLVMPVLQEVDDDGVVIRELQANQPTPVFGIEGLRKFADGFAASLAAPETVTLDDGEAVVTLNGPKGGDGV